MRSKLSFAPLGCLIRPWAGANITSFRRYRIPLFIAFIWVLSYWFWHDTSTHVALSLAKQHLNNSWTQRPHGYPVASLTPLPSGREGAEIPKIQAVSPKEDPAAKRLRLSRLEAVKASFKHSWTGYTDYAWMHDEMTPVGGKYRDAQGGWAATLVGGLDTLWIMGMKEEFEAAVLSAEKIDFTKSTGRFINVFQTTSQLLGGFLGAYELSGKKHPILLAKAVEVGELLMCAFDTPNRLPMTRWEWSLYKIGNNPETEQEVLISELGSLSLEFTKLSQLTGDPKYWDAVKRISDYFELSQQNTMLPGMWPTVVDTKTPSFVEGNAFTLGGMANSMYEYLPKQYLMLGAQLEAPRKMYESFIEAAKKHLFWRALAPWISPVVFTADVQASYSPSGQITYETKHQTQHLSCFAGGMVGMASRIFERPDDLELASQLTEGCLWAYNGTQSGISPEAFTFIPCHSVANTNDTDACNWSGMRWYKEVEERHRAELDAKPPANEKNKAKWTKPTVQHLVDRLKLPRGMVNIDDKRYELRPETIESVFIMYRLTGDPAWMDKAWYIFQSIERVTRTEIAASAVDDVTKRHPVQMDSMGSFWLAETLKYFYLIFSDFDVVSLDQWVLSTEAHPLKRPDV